MDDPFYIKDEKPSDALDRAQCILKFVQSWAGATHNSQFSEQEMLGLSIVTEAAGSLIHKAQEEVRGKGL